MSNPDFRLRYIDRVRANFSYLSRVRAFCMIALLAVILVGIVFVCGVYRNPLIQTWQTIWHGESPTSHYSANFEDAFQRFGAMSCGVQAAEASLWIDNGGGILRDILYKDDINGRVLGQYEVVVMFNQGNSFEYSIDTTKKKAQVTVKEFVISQPSVVGFVDESHSEGLLTKLSASEPIIDQVIQQGRYVIASNASNNYRFPNWFDSCKEEVEAQWILLGVIFGYDVQVNVIAPSKPLRINFGPIHVESTADLLGSY